MSPNTSYLLVSDKLFEMNILTVLVFFFFTAKLRKKMSADPDVKRQTIVANQQINILNAQLEALTMKHRRSELVEQELKALPTETVVYKALGRM
ncbi:prefoldin subunit 1 [Clonorchis sinensis]|uniref:Prefoldin subunit 1 n=1 Tax=Clonorchis sinensis TaxID=79923 RepID=G7Y4L5_CLOSI|nr:prefoldin subunit 1 [Clonorchis sinensis]